MSNIAEHKPPLGGGKTLQGVLKENLPTLAEDYFNIVMARPTQRQYGQATQERIIKSFEKVLDKTNINFVNEPMDTPQNALAALASGSVSASDAALIIKMLKDASDITDLKEMQDTLNKIAAAKNI